MIDAITGFLGVLRAMLGLLVLADPAMSGSFVTVAVLVLAVSVVVIAVIAASVPTQQRGSAVHPTRRIELSAPLTQSDPDAAGHIRRRGPGQVVPAA